MSIHGERLESTLESRAAVARQSLKSYRERSGRTTLAESIVDLITDLSLLIALEERLESSDARVIMTSIFSISASHFKDESQRLSTALSGLDSLTILKENP